MYRLIYYVLTHIEISCIREIFMGNMLCNAESISNRPEEYQITHYTAIRTSVTTTPVPYQSLHCTWPLDSVQVGIIFYANEMMTSL